MRLPAVLHLHRQPLSVPLLVVVLGMRGTGLLGEALVANTRDAILESATADVSGHERIFCTSCDLANYLRHLGVYMGVSPGFGC